MNDVINYDMNYKWMSAEEAYDLMINSDDTLRLTNSYDWNYPQFYKDMDGFINKAYPEEEGIMDTWETKDAFMNENEDETFRIA